MKKLIRITLLLESETNDDVTMTDDFIKRDLFAEISCACNNYEIVGIETTSFSNEPRDGD